jgi:hypothetical protein
MFKKKTGIAKDVLKSGFQIRVFPLFHNDEYPNATLDLADCFPMASLVKRFPASAAAEFSYGTVDAGDLQLSMDGATVWAGRYRLVFEKLDATKKAESAELFKLHKDSFKRYMDAGLVLTVSPTGFDIEAVRAAYKGRSDSLVDLRKIAPTVPCFEYVQYALGNEEDGLAEAQITACAPNSTTERLQF